MVSASGFRITLRKFEDGERFPFLVADDGQPLWYPTLFATTQFRNASSPPNTTRAALDAVAAVLHWANFERIDLELRFQSRRFLDKFEVLSLASFLKLSRSSAGNTSERATGSTIVSLERARAVTPRRVKSVSGAVAYQRITYAARYLEWLASHLCSPHSITNNGTEIHPEAMVTRLKKERPRRGKKSTVRARKALELAQANAIDDVTSVGGARNPFSEAVQSRNRLIVKLYELGLRGGELLAIKVSDFNFNEQTLVIPRRHNDPFDPRPNQPSAKTYDRLLPITNDLRDAVETYILTVRRRYVAAKRHEFLIVAQGQTRRAGYPLSSNALRKVVSRIRIASETIGLSGHVWRHDAATRQIRLLSSQGKGEAEQRKILAYQFGWSEFGDTVSTYVESYIQEEARKASLALQKGF